MSAFLSGYEKEASKGQLAMQQPYKKPKIQQGWACDFRGYQIKHLWDLLLKKSKVFPTLLVELSLLILKSSFQAEWLEPLSISCVLVRLTPAEAFSRVLDPRCAREQILNAHFIK